MLERTELKNTAFGATIDIHRQSTPHDELIDHLQQHDGTRTVVILDEVDPLEDPSVIYELHSLPEVESSASRTRKRRRSAASPMQ